MFILGYFIFLSDKFMGKPYLFVKDKKWRSISSLSICKSTWRFLLYVNNFFHANLKAFTKLKFGFRLGDPMQLNVLVIFQLHVYIFFNKEVKYWWWLMNCFCGMVDQRKALALFSARTIGRHPHHHKSLTRREQDLNLCTICVRT